MVDWRAMVQEDEDIVLFLEPKTYDAAILGIAHLPSTGATVVVYSVEGILEKLQRDGATLEEANEWFEFNIAGSNFGDETPIYVWTHREIKP